MKSSPIRDEIRFLRSGHAFVRELLWLPRILIEFIRGTWTLQGLGPTVSVFGSARFQEGHPAYALGMKTGAMLASRGYTVLTGGGPGLMEAASRGAKQAGGRTAGCNIQLPHEQAPNPYLDRSVTLRYFFVRKVMLVKYSRAFIILPGGMGTIDEVSEAVTLIQTGKLHHFPVILIGTDYWRGLIDWVQNTLIAQGAVSRDDLSFVRLTDDLEEAMEIIAAEAPPHSR